MNEHSFSSKTREDGQYILLTAGRFSWKRCLAPIACKSLYRAPFVIIIGNELCLHEEVFRCKGLLVYRHYFKNIPVYVRILALDML
jgi:hypothetical protein